MFHVFRACVILGGVWKLLDEFPSFSVSVNNTIENSSTFSLFEVESDVFGLLFLYKELRGVLCDLLCLVSHTFPVVVVPPIETGSSYGGDGQEDLHILVLVMGKFSQRNLANYITTLNNENFFNHFLQKLVQIMRVLHREINGWESGGPVSPSGNILTWEIFALSPKFFWKGEGHLPAAHIDHTQLTIMLYYLLSVPGLSEDVSEWKLCTIALWSLQEGRTGSCSYLGISSMKKWI